MRLVATRNIVGDYGTVGEGQQFDCPDDVAESLIARGLAHPATPPRVLYESKPMSYETKPARFEQPEVKPELGTPFRNGVVFDKKPPSVAPESDSVLAGTDVQEQRVVDNRGRHGRSRFGPKR